MVRCYKAGEINALQRSSQERGGAIQRMAKIKFQKGSVVIMRDKKNNILGIEFTVYPVLLLLPGTRHRGWLW